MKNNMNFFKRFYKKFTGQSVWARPQMAVTFRAELMPGRSREERTFRIEKVLPNGRVILQDFSGEHRQSSFEQIDFNREKAQKL